MAMVSPLIQSQPPEIRNTARFCSSSMVPTRPIGFMRLGARAGLVAGLDALAHAFGRDLARRDGVEADAVPAPFRRQRHGHGVDRRLAHRRRHHIGRAVAHPGHGDRHHVAGLLARDPAPADRMRHIERAVHDDVGDRIEAARRKIFRARDEIAGGVVDEIGEGARGPDRSIISSTAIALRMSTPWLTTRPPCRSISSVAVSSQRSCGGRRYAPRRRAGGSAPPSTCRGRCRRR